MSEAKFTKGKHDVSLISWMDEEYGGPYTETPEEAEANAKLYSAAPELYEALEGLISVMDTTEMSKLFRADYAKAKSALAKARGES